MYVSYQNNKYLPYRAMKQNKKEEAHFRSIYLYFNRLSTLIISI